MGGVGETAEPTVDAGGDVLETDDAGGEPVLAADDEGGRDEAGDGTYSAFVDEVDDICFLSDGVAPFDMTFVVGV